MRPAACGGAAAAKHGEILVAGVVAGRRAGVADFRAGAAGDFVQLRMPQHEVMGGVADLSAVEKHSNVFGAGVRTTLFEALMDGVLQGIVKFLASVDAIIHFGCLMFMNVGHLFIGGCALVSGFRGEWRGLVLG